MERFFLRFVTSKVFHYHPIYSPYAPFRIFFNTRRFHLNAYLYSKFGASGQRSNILQRNLGSTSNFKKEQVKESLPSFEEPLKQYKDKTLPDPTRIQAPFDPHYPDVGRQLFIGLLDLVCYFI